MCTMCAPRDQRKSTDNKREQAERAAVSVAELMSREGSDLVRQAVNVRQSIAEPSIRGMSGYGTTAFGGADFTLVGSRRLLLTPRL